MLWVITSGFTILCRSSNSFWEILIRHIEKNALLCYNIPISMKGVIICLLFIDLDEAAQKL
jgi:hypothetical protein